MSSDSIQHATPGNASPAGGLRKHARQGTVIPQSVLDDRSITFEALGLLCDMLTRPPGTTAQHAARGDRVSYRTVADVIQELQAAGYLDDDGRLTSRAIGGE